MPKRRFGFQLAWLQKSNPFKNTFFQKMVFIIELLNFLNYYCYYSTRNLTFFQKSDFLNKTTFVSVHFKTIFISKTMFLKTNLIFYSFMIKWLQLTIILFMLSHGGVSFATPPIAEEYQVKAVFLYNFANFIRWSQTAFSHSQAPFNICILGNDPFQQEIDVTVENELVEKHAVKVKRLNNMLNIDICQILFISQSEASYFTTILNSIRKRPILTVSDIDDFVNQGGMIQFFKYRKRIRFYIAPDTLKESGLQASGNLLRVAKIVRHR